MSERDTLPGLAERVARLEQEREEWITSSEFAPVKLLVYGMTGLMLGAVILALLALVVGEHTIVKAIGP